MARPSAGRRTCHPHRHRKANSLANSPANGPAIANQNQIQIQNQKFLFPQKRKNMSIKERGTIEFSIPGEPCGKGRPRFDSRSKRTFTPKKTSSYEGKVAVMFQDAAPGFQPDPDRPGVQIEIAAWFGMPKSWSKKKREAMHGKPCLKTPDADNLAKIICDALNGLAFVDDAQVYQVTVWKHWAYSGSVGVAVREVAHA